MNFFFNKFQELETDVQPFIFEPEYLAVTGSQAYGVATEKSDWDCYGFSIPPITTLFPSLDGYIPGFFPRTRGFKQAQGFDQWQRTKLLDDKLREHDFSIYNITKFFGLVIENNPNMVDSLFVPDHCVLVETEIGALVRKHKKEFLHKGSYHKFCGYAASQLHKIKGTERTSVERQKDIDKFGYSLKFAYHLVRLILECHQILDTGDLILDKNPEILKEVREGKWEFDKFDGYFKENEIKLEKKYQTSSLRESPDPEFVTNLLVQCIEMKVGKLKDYPLFNFNST